MLRFAGLISGAVGVEVLSIVNPAIGKYQYNISNSFFEMTLMGLAS
jgi:hypothetical protein